MADRERASWGERTVGEVVAEDYRRGSVFRTFGIDFCCGGGRSVRSACEEAGVEYDAVAAALEGAAGRGASNGSEDGTASDPRSWELDVLADHIVEEHHGYVRETLPVLRGFMAKVAGVHGARHPELHDIRELMDELGGELEEHLAEEETVLFPRIAALASRTEPDAGGDGANGGDGGVGGVGEAVIPLEDDHDRAGALMARIRDLSQGFTPPADACSTYRAAYATLAEFEADLHRHVHLENNILFPRAVAAESGRRA